MRVIARRVGLRPEQIDEMYQIMAIANYEDRFVIPTAHRELGADAYDMRGSCGFTFGNGCSGGESETNLFGSPRKAKNSDGDHVMKTFKVLSALLSYPTAGADRCSVRISSPFWTPNGWCLRPVAVRSIC